MYYLAFVRCYHSPEIINCSWQRTLQSQVMSLPIWSLMIHSFISNHPGYSLIQGFFFSFLISLFLYFGISFHYFLSFLLFPLFSLVIWLSKTSKQGEIVLEMLSNCTNILQLLETKTQLANHLQLKHIFTFKFKYFLRNFLSS